jgi:redox-sensitive bicupin YhaK (pirin superfamily)
VTIELIAPRVREIEPGMSVERLLPVAPHRHIGPFVFLDHMGPVPKAGDVRPHPHIGLATVTYLFEGAVTHRDTLGTTQVIKPGEVNWMTAGRGIAHSERTGGGPMHGVQLWVGLPERDEDTDPRFQHEARLPEVERDGVRLRVLLGDVFGAASAVRVSSPMFYVDARVPQGRTVPVPRFKERGVYVVDGALTGVAKGMFAVLPDEDVTLTAEADARVMMIGGEPLGERYIWWNYVSSRKERIIDAARLWKSGAFPKIPGDEVEFVPLVQDPHFTR